MWDVTFRVKENVNLNRFKKFGFVKHKNKVDGICLSKWASEWNSNGEFRCYPIILIYNDMNIKICIDRLKDIDSFYDLLRAGLIEKVEQVKGEQ